MDSHINQREIWLNQIDSSQLNRLESQALPSELSRYVADPVTQQRVVSSIVKWANPWVTLFTALDLRKEESLHTYAILWGMTKAFEITKSVPSTNMRLLFALIQRSLGTQVITKHDFCQRLCDLLLRLHAKADFSPSAIEESPSTALMTEMAHVMSTNPTLTLPTSFQTETVVVPQPTFVLLQQRATNEKRPQPTSTLLTRVMPYVRNKLERGEIDNVTKEGKEIPPVQAKHVLMPEADGYFRDPSGLVCSNFTRAHFSIFQGLMRSSLTTSRRVVYSRSPQGGPPLLEIDNDAVWLMMRCVEEFVAFVTAEVRDSIEFARTGSIDSPDILRAMNRLGMQRYVRPCAEYIYSLNLHTQNTKVKKRLASIQRKTQRAQQATPPRMPTYLAFSMSAPAASNTPQTQDSITPNTNPFNASNPSVPASSSALDSSSSAPTTSATTAPRSNESTDASNSSVTVKNEAIQAALGTTLGNSQPPSTMISTATPTANTKSTEGAYTTSVGDSTVDAKPFELAGS